MSVCSIKHLPKKHRLIITVKSELAQLYITVYLQMISEHSWNLQTGLASGFSSVGFIKCRVAYAMAWMSFKHCIAYAIVAMFSL